MRVGKAFIACVQWMSNEAVGIPAVRGCCGQARRERYMHTPQPPSLRLPVEAYSKGGGHSGLKSLETNFNGAGVHFHAFRTSKLDDCILNFPQPLGVKHLNGHSTHEVMDTQS